MLNYKTLFPDNSQEMLVGVEEIKGNTNFSYMGETDGIEIKCKAKFKVKVENVLMDPNWETNIFSDKFKVMFQDGYYVFEEDRFEYIHYHFFVDYCKVKDSFTLKKTKKIDVPSRNYISSVNKRYKQIHIDEFEKWLFKHIINSRIKKVQF